MKILIISQYFRPENIPINHIKDILSDIYEIDVLTGKANYPNGKFFSGYGFFSQLKTQDHDSEVFRLPIIPRGSGKFRGIKLFFNYISFVVSGLFFAPFLLRKKDYDLIFVYANSPLIKAVPGILLSRLKKIPLIIWVQDLWPESIYSTGIKLPRFFKPLINFIVNIIYKNADLLACQSRGFIKNIKENFDIPNDNFFYLPNTIDEKSVANNNQTSQEIDALFDDNKLNILFAGNIGFAQNLDLVIKSIKCFENDNICLHIVGDGSAKKNLQETVSANSIKNVLFHGSYPASNMASFYKKSDFLLLSLSDEPIYSLTIPNKLQGYLASGKPVIGLVSGISAKIIQDNNCGIVARSNSTEDLLHVFKTICTLQQSAIDRMSENCLKTYNLEFSNEEFLKKFSSMTKIIK